jgi:AcrR family transcriptional regulator
MSPRTAIQNEQIRKDSKHKITDAAFQLIAKNGYEATSIAMIAKSAGVSKGLLYNYFDSKEELVKAIVLGAMEEADKLLGEIISENPTITLKNIFQWFFKEMRERPAQWKLMTELTFSIEKFDFVHELVTSKMTEYIAFVEGLLAQMGYENAISEARVIAAILDGIGFHALMMIDEYPLAEMEEYLIKKYCNEE